MKTIALFVCMTLVASFLAGQVPESFSYQTVLRDASGNALANTAVSLEISILQGSVTGTQVFLETHNTSTNEFGLVTLSVGSVNPTAFSAINWFAGPYFIRIKVNNVTMGTSQLLSVPYALHAKIADYANGGDYQNLENKPDFTGWDKNVADDFSGSYANLSNKPVNIDEDKTDDVLLTGNQSIAGTKTFTGTVSAGNHNIIEVAPPLNASDVANKGYVDALESRIENLENEANRTGTFTDTRDGNTYKWVRLCDQVWMAENLRWINGYTHYANNDPNTKEEYGLLYGGSDACPSGWHLPTDREWKQMELCLGMSPQSVDSSGCRGTNQAAMLKIGGSTDFNVIFPGECRLTQYTPPVFDYRSFGTETRFWIDGYLEDVPQILGLGCRYITINSSKICRSLAGDAPIWFSIRCVKD